MTGIWQQTDEDGDRIQLKHRGDDFTFVIHAADVGERGMVYLTRQDLDRLRDAIDNLPG